MLYKSPPPYFIVLDCWVKTLQVKTIEFQIIPRNVDRAAE